MDEAMQDTFDRYRESVRSLAASNRELCALLRELAEREEFRTLAHKVVDLIRRETATWPPLRPPGGEPRPGAEPPPGA